MVEALACGKPVLITYQVNIWREIIQHGAGIIGDDTVNGSELLLHSWQQSSVEAKTRMTEQAKNCYLHEFAINSAAEKFQDQVISAL